MPFPVRTFLWCRTRGNNLPPVARGDSPEGHAVFTAFRPATFCPDVFFKDTDPVATAEAVRVNRILALFTSDKSFYLYFNELFISELALHCVILSVHALHLFPESRSDVLAMLMALH